MLTLYREEGCLFECRLRFAAKNAGCIPWDYPMPRNLSDMPLCTSSSGNYYSNLGISRTLEKFEQLMNSNRSLANCNCLTNCEEVEYETQVGVKRIH